MRRNLKRYQRSYGIKGISFMILNGRNAASSINKLTKLVSIPVYQEPQNKTYWEALDGKKDDILLYDRCGRLSSHIRMPKSNMRYPHVWNNLFTASGNQVCGKCTRVSRAKTTMATTRTTQQSTTPVTLETKVPPRTRP
ncbi:selenoprotein P-like [Actinia tenebrosa]|uniref:Selenoprotein P-like n=1 Tax=Actinia tenebrosa TaxID=6105 RepID=A0A6P8IHY5_ACTTE|nr:selenoprotein P-like [Actinia tenebrosa]